LEVFMRNTMLFGKAIVCILVCLLASCASAALYRPLSNLPNAEIIGSVQTAFSATSSGGVVTEAVKQQAYIKLKEIASEKYQGNIDIVNITVAYVKGGTIFQGYSADFLADGQVVLLGGGSMVSAAVGVEGALARAADGTLKNVQPGSKIAIVYITAQDKSTAEYIAGELEYIWVKAGYIIIDRSRMDRMRQEQNFQMSGEIDDETAVSIGKLIGANIILTGKVDGEGNLRRLRLRALDTQTAEVIGITSERF
jgi:ABC-type multidrug transport system fused ATPase/permease subunit